MASRSTENMTTPVRWPDACSLTSSIARQPLLSLGGPQPEHFEHVSRGKFPMGVAVKKRQAPHSIFISPVGIDFGVLACDNDETTCLPLAGKGMHMKMSRLDGVNSLPFVISNVCRPSSPSQSLVLPPSSPSLAPLSIFFRYKHDSRLYEIPLGISYQQRGIHRTLPVSTREHTSTPLAVLVANSVYSLHHP